MKVYVGIVEGKAQAAIRIRCAKRRPTLRSI
jgi:hypothetical protein